MTGLAYNTASLVCYYVRPLGSATQLALATQTVTGAHSDGGFVEVDATNMPGVYRLDLSDAVCATGVPSVVVMLKGATNLASVLLEIQLTDFDLNSTSNAVGAAASVTAGVSLADDAITAAKYDESTAFPLKSADTGATTVARVGADSDTLETLSDQLDAVKVDTAATLADTGTDGVVIAAAQTVATVTNLTNLPAITADWLTAAGVKADAVTKMQTGLALEATLTAIKGAGWSTETLTAIDVLIDAIKAKTDLLPASPAATSDIPAADITAIKAKTDLLPASPAATSDIPTANITAIKAKTDLLPASPAATGDIPSAGTVADYVWDELLNGHTVVGSAGAALAGAGSVPPTTSAIADAVWDELLAGHTVVGSTAAALAASGGASDPLLNPVPGAYASGTAGAALGRIGSGAITTVSPVSQSGNVETIQGDDYETALGRAIDWTDASADWPTLTGATIAVVIGSALELAGSVVTPTGGSKQVRVELTHTESAAIRVGVHPFQVIATLTGGDVFTLVEGQWTSKRRVTA